MPSDSQQTDRASMRERERVALAHLLRAQGMDDEALELFGCGRDSAIICQSCGHNHPVKTRCKRRYCPVCAHLRSRDLLRRYDFVVDHMTWPMMLTLTMPHKIDDCPDEMLTRLRKTFTSFRGMAWFRRACSGGIGAIEIAGGRNGWHIHIHALINCRWLAMSVPAPTARTNKAVRETLQRQAQAEVCDIWAAMLKVRKAAVWIRRANRKTIVEVLKYSVKFESLKKMDLPLQPLIAAIKGRRLVSAWGTVRDMAAAIRRHENTTRDRLMCPCGCSDWIPETVVTKLYRPADPVEARKATARRIEASNKEAIERHRQMQAAATAAAEKRKYLDAMRVTGQG